MFKWFLRGVVFYVAPLVVGLFVCAFMARADVIYGRVSDIGNGPMSGVEVTVERGTETVGVEITGSDGYFAVTDGQIQVSDNLALTFVKSKYITAVSSLTVGDASIAECSEVHMKRGTGTENLLTVNVMDGTSTVAGARVRFKRIGEWPVVKYSDSSGVCVFERLRSKTYNYSVVADGYVTLKGTKAVSGDEVIDLGLTAE